MLFVCGDEVASCYEFHHHQRCGGVEKGVRVIDSCLTSVILVSGMMAVGVTVFSRRRRTALSVFFYLLLAVLKLLLGF